MNKIKTIAFHSYKGGVGRTLTLSNLGIALSKIGMRVLMLDWDFDAPGLAIKWGVDERVKTGYADYLIECDKQCSAKGYHNRKDQIDFLENCIIEIEEYDNLYLLPSGDTSSKKYWNTIASRTFHDYFSYHNKRKMKINQDFFTEECEIFKLLKGGIDFLLIDSKTGDERASVPVLIMADSVVELFLCNEEGIFGDILIRKALHELELKHDKKVNKTSVMTRVPSNTSKKTALKKYDDMVRSITGVVRDKNHPENYPKYLPNKIEILHEQRELELAEKLLLSLNLSEERNNNLLSHDYIDLFEKVCSVYPGITKKIISSSPNSTSWRQAINLADSVGTVERYFTLSMARGELHNDDGKVNVSLRTETLARLLIILVEQQQSHGVPDELIVSAFHHAGKHAGNSFGEELINHDATWATKLPTNIGERLSQWCLFDKRAGFGFWEANYSSANNSGTLMMYNHFLAGIQNKENVEAKFGNAFLKGYVSSILTHLFSDQITKFNTIQYLLPKKDITLAFKFTTI